MNKILVMAAALALVLGFSASAYAQDFEFEASVEGDGELTWEVDFSESEDWTVNAGAEYNFGGGAGSDGDANAWGDLTGVGGVFGEYAYGTGDAYSNTLGGNYAEAEFHSGSGSLNGGYALNGGSGWADPAKIKYDGIVTAGGAGSAETGLTVGTNYDYNQTGSIIYDVDADLNFEYDETP